MAYGTFLERSGFSGSPWVQRILLANVVVFILSVAIPQGFLVRWFGFVPAEILSRPWGIFTYMFLHAGFWHVLFNMLVVFFFGPPLEQRLGGVEFLKLYLLGGLGGALLGFVFAFNTPVIGASAAVYALMLAFAWFWPNAPIYIWGIFPLKAKFLVAGLALFTFLATLNDAPSTTAHFAHLGGLIAGFLYLRFGHRGWTAPDFLRRVARAPRVAIVYRNDEEEGEGIPFADEPDAPRPRRRTVAGSMRARMEARRGGASADESALLDEVDRILEKISASGMASLSDSERRVLDEVSRQRRSN
jgi:membrane associated rhomboid family serine protease